MVQKTRKNAKGAKCTRKHARDVGKEFFSPSARKDVEKDGKGMRKHIR
jgi:hypothetical protein